MNWIFTDMKIHDNVNENAHSKIILPHCELEPAIYWAKRERATIAPVDPTKSNTIKKLFVKFLQIRKYAFTQKALDAF
jgi:hypothetical protein